MRMKHSSVLKKTISLKGEDDPGQDERWYVHYCMLQNARKEP
jgi:hypothetical protein